MLRCFNPRPRTGSDAVLAGKLVVGVVVSIRAPARGATYGLKSACHDFLVSIRAPARGATP